MLLRHARRRSTAVVLCCAVWGIAASVGPLPAAVATGAPAAAASSTVPAEAFFAEVAALCGLAFEGRVVVDRPESGDDRFAGRRLVMFVGPCSEAEIRMPFHVGDDRSRTWVLTATSGGLRLKHDHRHADGSPDPVTMYGGDTTAPGSAMRQEFPVDAESVAVFERAGLAASLTNTWALEIEPGRRFLYELSRPGGRLFQVEFDLGKPVPAPPPAWGSEVAAQ